MDSRPVIVLTSDVRVERRILHFVFANYVDAIERAGGLPMHVPVVDPGAIPQVMEMADAFVFVGGEDIHPSHYGEEPDAHYDPAPEDRQAFDLELGRALLYTKHPVLGICYGCQLLTIVTGGALHQHLPADGPIAHHGGKFPDLPHHPLDVTAGSRLHRIVGSERINVNTAHHQAPKSVGPGLVASGRAPDGTIEAVEASGDRFLLGVEWHPELMPDDPAQQAIFRALVKAAGR